MQDFSLDVFRERKKIQLESYVEVVSCQPRYVDIYIIHPSWLVATPLFDRMAYTELLFGEVCRTATLAIGIRVPDSNRNNPSQPASNWIDLCFLIDTCFIQRLLSMSLYKLGLFALKTHCFFRDLLYIGN